MEADLGLQPPSDSSLALLLRLGGLRLVVPGRLVPGDGGWGRADRRNSVV
jgi:hypothetical protein